MQLGRAGTQRGESKSLALLGDQSVRERYILGVDPGKQHTAQVFLSEGRPAWAQQFKGTDDAAVVATIRVLPVGTVVVVELQFFKDNAQSLIHLVEARCAWEVRARDRGLAVVRRHVSTWQHKMLNKYDGGPRGNRKLQSIAHAQEHAPGLVFYRGALSEHKADAFAIARHHYLYGEDK